MKKITFAICIASIAIFTLPAVTSSSAIVVRDEGEIEGLVFDLSPGLPVQLPGIDMTIKFIEIEAQGIEQIVITPSGRYNYNCTLGQGKIYAWEEVPELDNNGIPLRDEEGNSFESPPNLTVAIGSATSNEHFAIPDFDPDDPDFDPHYVETPDDVNLYFTAMLIGILDAEENTIPLDPPIPYKLKLNHGAVLFIMP